MKTVIDHTKRETQWKGDLNSMQRQRKNSTGREQALEVQRKEKTSGVLGIQEGWCGWSRRSERKYQIGVIKRQMVCGSTQINSILQMLVQ